MSVAGTRMEGFASEQLRMLPDYAGQVKRVSEMFLKLLF